MQKKTILSINKGTITVISIMTVIVLIGITVAYFYYGGINNAEDPRVIDAKDQYQAYNNFVVENDSESAFATLDTIEYIYLKHSDYKNSYELGVVYNNKLAVWLTSALLKASNGTDNLSELDSAQRYGEKSIVLYENWLTDFKNLKENEVRIIVEKYYKNVHFTIENLSRQDVIEKRIKDIIIAQEETPKRLSVTYTNIGIIQRHKAEYENAMASYKKAIELWDGNRDAKNNINILLGRPIDEITVIEKIFPEEK